MGRKRKQESSTPGPSATKKTPKASAAAAQLLDANDEAEALAATTGTLPARAATVGARLPLRRLADLRVTQAGANVPVDAVLSDDVRVSGVVFPATGPMAKGDGRKVADLGALAGWEAVFRSDRDTMIVIRTAGAEYEVVKPANAYKKVWESLADGVALARTAWEALDGSLAATLDDVKAAAMRAGAAKRWGKAEDAFRLNAPLVLACLEQAAARPGAPAYAATKAVADLRALGASVGYVAEAAGHGVKIDASNRKATAALDDQERADLAMAQRLQAELDREMNAGPVAKAEPVDETVPVEWSEIATDYPEDVVKYEGIDEVDEYRTVDEQDYVDVASDALPRRVLRDFVVYDDEGIAVSLELASMAAGGLSNATLFFSGDFTEDDGSGWATVGQPLVPGVARVAAATPTARTGNGAGNSRGGGRAAPAAAAAADDSVRICSGEIREWKVEVIGETLQISVRTDCAWYRLADPRSTYATVFDVVLHVARVGAFVLNRMTRATRASKISFEDIVRGLAAESIDSPTHVAAKAAGIERFLTVHGAVVLSLLRGSPVKQIRESSVAVRLLEAMKVARRSRIYVPKEGKVPKNATATMPRAPRAPGAPKVPGQKRVANPMKDRLSGAKRPMEATATRLVRRIYADYYMSRFKYDKEGKTTDRIIKGDEKPTMAGEEADEEEVDEEEEAGAEAADKNEEDDDEAEEAVDVLDAALESAEEARDARRAATGKKGAKAKSLELKGAGTKVDGVSFWTEAVVDGAVIELGTTVGCIVAAPEIKAKGRKGARRAAVDDDDEPMDEPVRCAGVVQCIYKEGSVPMAQVRMLISGKRSFLADAANPFEVFVTEDVKEVALAECMPVDTVARGGQGNDPATWGHGKARATAYDALVKLEDSNVANAGKAEKTQLFYRRLYVPELGAFMDLPVDLAGGRPAAGVALRDIQADLNADGGVKRAKECPEAEVKLGGRSLPGDTLVVRARGTVIAAGDHAYVKCGVFLPEDASKDKRERPEYVSKRGTAKGDMTGVDAWHVVKVTEVKKNGKVEVVRLHRPEELDRDLKHITAYKELFFKPASKPVTIDASALVRRCWVVGRGEAIEGAQDVFECHRAYLGKGTGGHAKIGSPGSADAEIVGPAPKSISDLPEACRIPEREALGDERLKCLDIFAGCGGLSEGFHHAGIAETKWAIEYERPAAEAFKLNNPEAHTFCENCNVVLYKGMEKAKEMDDCFAPEDNVEAAAAFSEGAHVPVPGEVDLICGGPPCQGYSGMNRFNKSNWSMVQNSMIMSFLSYADFYRPKVFLLENVRTFASHNKTRTFRLAVRSLLEMGYQVRFGVLNAGNFGVAQSRKRTFLWGVAPGMVMPEWPRPVHAFKSPQLTVQLPNNVKYCAVPSLEGAPQRSVSVRDTIGDLPAIENGASEEKMSYGRAPGGSGAAEGTVPVNDFQREIRKRADGSECTELVDHICKTMNELNAKRCSVIPPGVPGADWRHLRLMVNNGLEEKTFKGKDGIEGDLVPWCLPNTEKRHNGWRGLFGRLDWYGHFPTSVTDPQPMGKVGQVFHPEQNRIVSVRECARSQGFPDSFCLYGNVHNKHRQVGNAVPVPLSKALGRELVKAVQATRAREQQQRK